MNFFPSSFSSFIILLCVCFFYSGAAFGYAKEFDRSECSSEQKEYLTKLMKRIGDNWQVVQPDPQSIPPSPEISFVLQDDGQITDVTITRSTGLTVCDLACVDAVLGTSPANPPLVFKSPLWQPKLHCDFRLLREDTSGTWAATGTAGGGQIKQAHHNAYPELSNPIWFPHGDETYFSFPLISADVRGRYPGVLSEADIYSKENYARIKVTSADSVLQKLRQSWTEFFTVQKHPNRDDLLKKRDDMKIVFKPWLERAQDSDVVRAD